MQYYLLCAFLPDTQDFFCGFRLMQEVHWAGIKNSFTVALLRLVGGKSNTEDESIEKEGY